MQAFDFEISPAAPVGLQPPLQAVVGVTLFLVMVFLHPLSFRKLLECISQLFLRLSLHFGGCTLLLSARVLSPALEEEPEQ